MLRKLLSIVGILAMLITFAPELVGVLDASSLPSCCDGVMCPMHKMVNGRVLCGMVMVNAPNGAFQSCPGAAAHFAALPFLRVPPQVLRVEWLVARFAAPAPLAAASVMFDVPCPPPRTSAL